MNAAAEIKYTGMKMSEKEWNDIWEILCLCDREFVPALSSRNSTSQTNLLVASNQTAESKADSTEESTEEHFAHVIANNAHDKPHTYFSELRLQQFILAKQDDRVTGFLSFKTEYICDALAQFGYSNYITTVCVTPEQRGHGILNQLYDYMENELPQQVKCSRITTRTWSQNDAQIHTLRKRGYELLKTLANDRGRGIDTLYFGKAAGSISIKG